MDGSMQQTKRDPFKVLILIFLSFILLSCAAVSRLPDLIVSPTPTFTASPTSTITLTPTPTATPTATEIPTVCGGPRTMFILLIGSDARSNTYNVGLADAIRLVRVDFVEPGLQALTFPRDLYVEIPGIEVRSGITHGKLNQAFLYGNPGYAYFDDARLGPGLLADTLTLNFDAHSEHYISVNLQTFTKTVDSLGGIDIDLPEVVDGRVRGSRDNRLYFPAGEQHLGGYRTMLLARMRPNGDLERSEIQNLILEALTSQLLSPDVITKLPELAETFKESVQTDMGAVEIGQLACLATMIDAQDVEFMNFPSDLFESGRVQDPVLGSTSILEADFDVLRNLVQEFNDGAWKTP